MARILSEDEVTFTLTCEPEYDSIEGNVLVSGDERQDKAAEVWVYKQLSEGNVWAWCSTCVEAEWQSISAKVYRGNCCCTSEEAFKQSETYRDMKQEAFDILCGNLEDMYDILQMKKDRWEAEKIKNDRVS